MRPTRVPAVLLIALALALPRPADAQEHAHDAPVAEAEAEPLLRLMLEGPHLALAHHGFIVFTGEQLDALRAARSRVCAAEVAYVHERTRARAELAGLLAGEADDARARAAVDRLAQVEADWMLALVRARRETLAPLRPAERQQVAWLGEHWAREARDMIAGATHAGHRGHPGTQVPIRVPGMVVADTTLVPACEMLHISVPPR